jgi:hypothetical protein
MGFPEQASGDVKRHSRSRFRSFRSYIDGHPVETRFVRGVSRNEFEYTYWHVKSVPFAAGQTRTVVDQYTSGLGGVSDGTRFFSYVLRTGKSWKGRIGEAMINVDTSALPSYYSVAPKGPAGHKSRGHRITWVLRDFEPEENVTVNLQPVLRVLVNGTPRVPTEGPIVFARGGVVMASAGYLEFVERMALTRVPGGREFVFTRNENRLRVYLGKRTAVLNDSTKVNLPRAPYKFKGNLIIPIESVVRALGGRSSYDPRTGLKLETGPEK